MLATKDPITHRVYKDQLYVQRRDIERGSSIYDRTVYDKLITKIVTEVQNLR